MTKEVRNPNYRKCPHAIAATRRPVPFLQPFLAPRQVTAIEAASRFGIRIPPQPVPLPWGTGQYQEVAPLDEAALSACEDRGFAVPKGQARIAQRFNVGLD